MFPPRIRSARSLAAWTLLCALACKDRSQQDRDEDDAGASAPVESRTPTFVDDVGPLVHRECTPCHHEGGSGPFVLESYDDVKDHGRQIVEVTRSGFMPPWLPTPGYGRFVGERILSDADNEILRRWVDAGAPQGDPARTPAPPRYEGGWQLGEPDLVVSMDDAFTVPADGIDVYRNFVLSVPAGPAHYIKAVELQPGDPQVVHHAVLRIDLRGQARRLDRNDSDPGFDGMVVDAGKMPGGRFIGWTPGKAVDPGSDDRAWHLPGGADLVLQLHLRPTGAPREVKASVGLYFAAGPPSRGALAMELSSLDIDLPAGASSVRVQDSYELPVDAMVLSAYPHAHYLGKQLHGYAVLPDGSKRWLIKIDDWDFNWQDQYRYERPVRLPAGSVIHMDYRYDNSAANPHNPFDPPRDVVHGPSSTDEMAELILEIEPVDPSDLGKLDEDFMRKWLTVQVDGYRRRLEREPADAEALAGLAALHQRLGETSEAIAAFERAASADPKRTDTLIDFAITLMSADQLDRARKLLRTAGNQAPDDPRIHRTLGDLERRAGAPTKAIRSYEKARELDPDDAGTHNNLAITYEGLGRLDEAEAAMQRATELSPFQPQFPLNLGRIREKKRDGAGAVSAYRKALELQPGSLQAMRGLAWILATDSDDDVRNPSEALRIAHGAARATGNRAPEILDALAAAHAAQGRFPIAVQILETALQQARSVDATELAEGIESRLRSYREGKPYVGR